MGIKCVNIGTDSTHTLDRRRGRQVVKFGVTATNAAGSAMSWSPSPVWSHRSTAAVEHGPAGISARHRRAVLSTTDGSWTGNSAYHFIYRWQRCDDDVTGLNCVNIAPTRAPTRDRARSAVREGRGDRDNTAARAELVALHRRGRIGARGRAGEHRAAGRTGNCSRARRSPRPSASGRHGPDHVRLTVGAMRIRPAATSARHRRATVYVRLVRRRRITSGERTPRTPSGSSPLLGDGRPDRAPPSPPVAVGLPRSGATRSQAPPQRD